MRSDPDDIPTVLDALQSGLADLNADDSAPILGALDALASLFEAATKANLQALARLSVAHEVRELEYMWWLSGRPRLDSGRDTK